MITETFYGEKVGDRAFITSCQQENKGHLIVIRGKYGYVILQYPRSAMYWIGGV